MVTQPAGTDQTADDKKARAEKAAAELEASMERDEARALAKRDWSDDQLRGIDSLDSIKALLGDTQIGSATDLGNGFAVLDREGKNRLCGVPCLFLSWQFNKGENGEFVSALVVQLDMTGNIVGKFVVNDGSTGIYQQLRDYTDRTETHKGLMVPKGLRRSDYDYTDEKTGELRPASTFYIDTSPAA